MKIFKLLITSIICFNFFGCLQKEEPKPLQQTITPPPQPVKKALKKKRTKKVTKPVTQTLEEPKQVNQNPATQIYTIEQSQQNQEQHIKQEQKPYIYTITQ